MWKSVEYQHLRLCVNQKGAVVRAVWGSLRWPRDSSSFVKTNRGLVFKVNWSTTFAVRPHHPEELKRSFVRSMKHCQEAAKSSAN